jgi:AP-1 complex subunit beta-1
VRDRGYIYWRLLSTDPVAAKAIVMAERPTISTTGDDLETSLLDELILNISSLASVYQKPPKTFILHAKTHVPPSNAKHLLTSTTSTQVSPQTRRDSQYQYDGC